MTLIARAATNEKDDAVGGVAEGRFMCTVDSDEESYQEALTKHEKPRRIK